MEATVEGPKYECLLFDLDDTLYVSIPSVLVSILLVAKIYKITCLTICKLKNTKLQKCAWNCKEYGTTMAGLKALGYEFDNDEFHENVHGTLPYANLRPDPVLRTLLLYIPRSKLVR